MDELERKLVKQECFNQRNNIKLFGINDREQESPEDTEKVLRKFLHKEIKMSSDNLNEIEFEGSPNSHKTEQKKETTSKTYNRKIFLLQRQGIYQIAHQAPTQRQKVRRCR